MKSVHRIQGWFVLVLLASAIGGCTEAIGGAARSSLGSFLTSVFSAAVNSVLTP